MFVSRRELRHRGHGEFAFHNEGPQSSLAAIAMQTGGVLAVHPNDENRGDSMAQRANAGL
jgi:hypothetical protein